MAHSPLKMFKSFHKKHCLISGQGPIVDIAKYLGFTRLTTIEDLRQSFPNLDVVDHKRRLVAPCALGRYFPPIESIVLFGEPVRWETSLQLILDVLLTDGKLDHEEDKKQEGKVEGPNLTMPYPHLPILACNMDLVWMSEANMPRFGHGTFLHCLEQIYHKLSGYELKYTALVGKPTELTYMYAEQCLHQHSKAIDIKSNIKRIYAIGDNIDTDISGANLYDLHIKKNKQKPRLVQQQGNQNSLTTTFDADIDSLINESKIASISSILVCTGVYRANNIINSNKDGIASFTRRNLDYGHKDMVVDDPAIKQPKYTCKDAYEAISLIFDLENNIQSTSNR
jgi:HAD superfamily hydrolase (TIGR01456 family)